MTATFTIRFKSNGAEGTVPAWQTPYLANPAGPDYQPVELTDRDMAAASFLQVYPDAQVISVERS